jgi:signal transduction histidine kinase
VKADPTDWLFDHLGLPVLKEDEQLAISASDAAHELLGCEVPTDLAAGLRRILGEESNGLEIVESITRARAGTPCELRSASGRRVLLSQHATGRALAVVAPAASPARTSLAPVEPTESNPADVNAGVSHELANALGAIAGWARLAKQGRRVQEALDLIEMSAESAWSAAQRVLGGLRTKREKTPESVDLSAFVDEAARLLAPKALAKGVHVRTAIEPGLRVLGDRGSAWSIVWNLAANAVEALSAGGTVELRLSSVGEVAVLIVEDDGPGMNAEQQRRAFEPYFTTKPTGTGLGLPLVKQAVADVGGSIELHSELGRGARFSIALPLAAVAQRQLNLKRSSGVFYAEPIHKRILVVDDDLGLREMVSTALGMRGAEVVAVSNAEAALAQTGPFHVALVDLLLPGMRGDALLAHLREAQLIDVGLLMTGTELPNNLAAGGAPDLLLRKPFELEELFESLAAALGLERDAQQVG